MAWEFYAIPAVLSLLFAIPCAHCAFPLTNPAFSQQAFPHPHKDPRRISDKLQRNSCPKTTIPFFEHMSVILNSGALRGVYINE